MARGPMDLDTRGRKLWRNLLKQDPRLAAPANPNRDIALQACRVADQLDRLADEMSEQPMTIIRNNTGDVAMNPVWVEFRALSPLLARLIVALRLPDEVTGAVPQRRGTRGAYGGGKSGKVSSLEAARRAAAR